MNRAVSLFGFLLIVGFRAQAQPLDDGFELRFAQGTENQSSAQGTAYLKALTPLFRRVGQKCALGVTAGDRESFKLVADVDGRLRMTNVQVKPSTSRSSCFAIALEAETVPTPPTSPFVVSISVVLAE